MIDFTIEPKEKLNQVIAEFDKYTARIQKIKEQIAELSKEISKLDQDKNFEEYHAKNQEINYYNEQLVKAVDQYHTKRVHNRNEIEASLYNPIVKGLKATQRSVDYENEKDKIIQDFAKKMNALGKKHNEKVLKYIEGIYPELEQVKEHFADTDFNHINLMQVTTPHYYFKRPLEEYLKENSDK